MVDCAKSTESEELRCCESHRASSGVRVWGNKVRWLCTQLCTILHSRWIFPRDNEWIFSAGPTGPLFWISRLKLVHHSMYTVLKERKQSLTFL